MLRWRAGLFGITFPPGFAAKRYFYASYISKDRGAVGDLIVARYYLGSDPGVADPASEQIILIVPQPTPLHHGGQLAFGPKDGLLDPILEYPHTNGCAILGGKVYRDATSQSLTGIYFFADYCSGRIWGRKKGGESWQSNLLSKEGYAITDIGSDEAGNLYVANYTQGSIAELKATTN